MITMKEYVSDYNFFINFIDVIKRFNFMCNRNNFVLVRKFKSMINCMPLCNGPMVFLMITEYFFLLLKESKNERENL